MFLRPTSATIEAAPTIDFSENISQFGMLLRHVLSRKPISRRPKLLPDEHFQLMYGVLILIDAQRESC